MKLISVVLLDDDRFVLEDLESMIDWTDLGFSLFSTTNPTKALQYINKYKPQIFITDIIMPGMDGLTLIEILQQTWPEMKILIISSHDEFDYAKRAIKLGVCDYILKNEITALSFTEKLLSLSSAVQESSFINSSLLTQEFTRYFQTASIPAPVLKSFAPILEERFFFFIVSQTLPFYHHIQEINTIISYSLEYLSDSLKQIDPIPIAFQFPCETFLIFAVRIKNSVKGKKFLYSSTAKQILQFLSSRSNQPCILFFYPELMKVTAFHDLYLEMLPLLRFYSVFYTSQLINLEELRDKELYIAQTRIFPFQVFSLSEQHLEESLSTVKQYLTQCFNQRDIQAMLRFYQTFCTHMEVLSHGEKHFMEPKYFSTLEFMLKWIFDTYTDLLKEKQDGHSRQFSLAVKSAIDFMQDHYSNYELTAEIISRHVALSPGRLNILFKKETNRTLNEYLTNLRMKEALYFLQNTNLKIYEISEKCGYKSSQYFSQVFNQHTGKRPLDFRRMNQKPQTAPNKERTPHDSL